MNGKKFILSSSGLKNIINEEKRFAFIFGERKIEMGRISAEFLSPFVSRLHHLDITIDSIIFKYPHNTPFLPFEELFSEEMIKIVQQVSEGKEISLTKEQSQKLQQISILLGNDELYDSLQSLYPQSEDKFEIDDYFRKLSLFQYNPIIPGITTEIQKNNIIESISSHFYLIDQTKLKKLPKSILYEIISNEHLKIESEDSLFDFINDIFDEENSIEEAKTYEMRKVDFYEKLLFINMSEDKFKVFLNKISGSEMTVQLWRGITGRFFDFEPSKERYINNNKPNQKKEKKKENQQIRTFLFNGDSFNGIIREMNRECNGNAVDKGIISITATPGYGDPVSCIVDFDNLNTNHFTNSDQNGFIQYDFKEKKVKPNHYSIRTWKSGVNNHHLKSWVIEGSNDGSNNWKILDAENNVTFLNSESAYHTFKIKENLSENDFYRFLRLRITGPNTFRHSNYQICISGLEYFGSII